MSLFVTELGFTDPALRDEAKVGVLVASLVAAVAGWALFRRRTGGRPPSWAKACKTQESGQWRRPATSVRRRSFPSPTRGWMFRRFFAIAVLLCLLCVGGAVGTLAWADKQSGTGSPRASPSRESTSAA